MINRFRYVARDQSMAQTLRTEDEIFEVDETYNKDKEQNSEDGNGAQHKEKQTIRETKMKVEM